MYLARNVSGDAVIGSGNAEVDLATDARCRLGEVEPFVAFYVRDNLTGGRLNGWLSVVVGLSHNHTFLVNGLTGEVPCHALYYTHIAYLCNPLGQLIT